jgi:hypothetical protein
MCMSAPKIEPPKPLPEPPPPPELRIKGKGDEGRMRAARGRNALRTDAPGVGLAIAPGN